MEQQAKKLITLKNISITSQDQTLIKYFNLELLSGECKIISAPTGSGKTTLFNYIADILPSKGFKVSGELLKTPGLKISYAFQEPRLISSVNVIQNIMLPLQNLLDSEHAMSVARIWLQKFNLLNKVNESPLRLSGGEQQRANLARAFAYSQVLSSSKKCPCVLLLDEPFASQDEQNARNIETLIREQLLLPDVGCLIISHNTQNISSDFFKLSIPL